MRQFLIIVFFLVYILSVSGQVHKIEDINSLEWKTSSRQYEKAGYTFEGAIHEFGKEDLPFFVKTFPLAKNSLVQEVRLIPIDTLILVEEEVLIKNSLIQKDFRIEYSILTQNQERILQVSLLPIKCSADGSKYIRLKNFKLKVDLKDNVMSSLDMIQYQQKESPLSKGDWYKYRIPKTDIYKISGKDLESIGIDLKSIDINNVRIFGFSEGALKEEIDDQPIPNLIELPVRIRQKEKDVFSEDDFLLFYARGADRYAYNFYKERFDLEKNYYSKYSYVFINVGQIPSKKILNGELIDDTVDTKFDTFLDYKIYYKDSISLLRTGRIFVDDKRLDEEIPERIYEFDFPGIIKKEKVFVDYEFVARTFVEGKLVIGESKQDINIYDTVSITKVKQGSSVYARMLKKECSYFPNRDLQELVLNFSGSKSAEAYISYIQLSAYCNLNYSEKFSFRNPASLKSGGIHEYQITNASDEVHIWNVTDLTDVNELELIREDNLVKFNVEQENSLLEFIAFSYEEAVSPQFVDKIENQNLCAIPSCDYLIISAPEFIEYAKKLKDIHNQNNDLSIQVVNVEKIYNEYGGGRLDPSAIRNFIRSIYLKGTDDNRLKYVCLFGNASFDYEHEKDNRRKMVPTYESIESFRDLGSFCSDDYFALMDIDEGLNCYGLIDLGIGRIVAENQNEAESIINKIKRYYDITDFEEYQSELCLLADHGDGNLHIKYSEKIATLLEKDIPDFHVNKIYLDAFEEVYSGGVRKFPKAQEKLKEAFEQGSSIISYFGHGDSKGFSSSKVLDHTFVNSLSNKYNLPLMITATCEFAQYDDPLIDPCGFNLLAKEDGGAIALVTTSRKTMAHDNLNLTTKIFKKLKDVSDDKTLRFGDLLKSSKDFFTSNNLNYYLLGDPALPLKRPSNKIKISHFSSINDGGLENDNDSIFVGNMVSFSGIVSNKEGIRNNDFNGKIKYVLYDQPNLFNTMANHDNDQTYDFMQQNKILYEGLIDVKDGEFNGVFKLPAKVSEQKGKPKLFLFGYDNEKSNASGFYDDFKINTTREVINDGEGPKVSYYFNSPLYKKEDCLSFNSTLYLFLEDKDGINFFDGEIGQQINLIIDNNSRTKAFLKNRFVPVCNDYSKGEIVFPIQNLQKGRHNITFTAYDLLGNKTVVDIPFYVGSKGDINLNRVYAFPNPAKKSVSFFFEHNQIPDTYRIDIGIYNLQGGLIHKISKCQYLNSSSENVINWDIDKSEGAILNDGVYLFKFVLTDKKGNQSLRISKLVISRN